MRLIDADALYRMHVPVIEGDAVHYEWVVFAEDINEAPTIDTKPVRHGKFIGTKCGGYVDGNPVYYEWKCSECGCIFEDEEPTYRYCPNCGARMDAEREEE